MERINENSEFIKKKLKLIRNKVENDIKESSIPSFSEALRDRRFQNNMLKREYEYLKVHFNINSDISIKSDNLLKKSMKKIIMKLTQFYIKPIVEKQSNYNIHVSNTFGRVISTFNYSWIELEELKNRIDKLEESIKK